MRGKTIEIGEKHWYLLKYIVKYMKLRGRSSARGVAQQLIIGYAKKLVTGMPEELWRKNMLSLINDAEKEA